MVKIESNKEDTLTDLVKGAVEQLLCPTLLSQDDTIGGKSIAGNHNDAQLYFSEPALKWQGVQDKAEGSTYVNTRFLLPTFCVVERLFSQVKRVLVVLTGTGWIQTH